MVKTKATTQTIPVQVPGGEGVSYALVRRLSLEGQLWVLVVTLMVVGTIMVYSGSALIAAKRFADPYHYLKRQLVIVAIGIAVMLFVSRFPYRWYQSLARLLLAGALVALGAVLIPGVGIEFNNASRWFQVGGFFVQPSEYAKVAWVLYLCAYGIRKGERIKDFYSGFLPPMLLFALMTFFLIKEPDFGTLVILALVTVCLLLTVGALWRHLALLLIPTAVGLYGFVYLVPYRWSRVVAFLNPWTDPLDSGYQLIQSWIAIGSGGLWGRGLGAGHQKLFFLPEPFTDFVFAVIGEELGFVGVTLLVALFALLFWKGLQVAQNVADPFGSLLALGLITLFLIQCLMNMGVVLGLLPTKGLALPFISYGGSALTANCVAVGILMNIARNSEQSE